MQKTLTEERRLLDPIENVFVCLFSYCTCKLYNWTPVLTNIFYRKTRKNTSNLLPSMVFHSLKEPDASPFSRLFCIFVPQYHSSSISSNLTMKNMYLDMPYGHFSEYTTDILCLVRNACLQSLSIRDSMLGEDFRNKVMSLENEWVILLRDLYSTDMSLSA